MTNLQNEIAKLRAAGDPRQQLRDEILSQKEKALSALIDKTYQTVCERAAAVIVHGPNDNSMVYLGNTVCQSIDGRKYLAFDRAFGPRESAARFIGSFEDLDARSDDGDVGIVIRLAVRHGKSMLTLTHTGKEVFSRLEARCRQDRVTIRPYTRGTAPALIGYQMKTVYYPAGVLYAGYKGPRDISPALVIAFSV